jgi:hypothetical protein
MMGMTEWKYWEKIRDSKNRGIVIGIGIAMGVLALAGIICLIVRFCCGRSYFFENCCCDDDDFDDDDDDESGAPAPDEEAFVYAKDKDFE